MCTDSATAVQTSPSVRRGAARYGGETISSSASAIGASEPSGTSSFTTSVPSSSAMNVTLSPVSSGACAATTASYVLPGPTPMTPGIAAPDGERGEHLVAARHLRGAPARAGRAARGSRAPRRARRASASTSGRRWPPTSWPRRFSAHLIAIGFATTRSRSIDGASSSSSARAPSTSPSRIAPHHLLHLRPDDVRVDADAAEAAELEEREDEVVVARVEIEAELDDRARLLEIGVRLLDRADGRDLRELRDRLRLEIEDDPRRDVVDDDRAVGDGGDLLEVPDDPAHRRLVVVRRHDEEAVDAELVRARRQVHRVLGRVRARAGDDGGAIADLVDRRLVQPEAARRPRASAPRPSSR